MTHEKKNIAGVLVSPIEYSEAIQFVASAAKEKRSAMVSALAVHGVMTGVLDREHRYPPQPF